MVITLVCCWDDPVPLRCVTAWSTWQLFPCALYISVWQLRSDTDIQCVNLTVCPISCPAPLQLFKSTLWFLHPSRGPLFHVTLGNFVFPHLFRPLAGQCAEVHQEMGTRELYISKNWNCCSSFWPHQFAGDLVKGHTCFLEWLKGLTASVNVPWGKCSAGLWTVLPE